MQIPLRKTSVLLSTVYLVLGHLFWAPFLDAQENPQKDANEKRAAARAKAFSQMDQDHNGSLSPQEFKAAPQFKDNQERSSKVFAKLDTDGNGALSKEEFVDGAPKKENKQHGATSGPADGE